jgi:hypothetical protein
LAWRFYTGGQLYHLISLIFFILISSLLGYQLVNVEVPDGETLLSTSEGVLNSLGVIITFAGVIWTAAQYISKTLLPGSASSAENFLKFGKDPLETVRKHYKRLLKRIRRPVIIFIDDLDRCNQEYVVGLFETLNNLFSDAHAFYVIAADREWLYACFESVYEDFTESLQEPGRRLGYLFLQKSFQLSIKVPMMTEEVVKVYIEAMSQLGKEELASSIESLQKQATEEFRDAASEEQIIQKLDMVPKNTLEEQVYRSAAVRQTAEKKIEEETEVYLRDFASLLEPNPRAIKRLVNAYGIYRALAILSGLNTFDPAGKEQFVLWIILSLRWPMLAEYLEEHPAMVAAFIKSKAKTNVPESLQPLIEDSHLLRVIKGRNVNLDATAIERFYGIAGF